MRIDNLYIKESARIINTYQDVIKSVETISNLLTEYKTKLSNILNKINNIENIQDTTTELQTTIDIQETILEYDKEITKLNFKLQPFLDKMEKIKKESSLLYKTIKENYPGVDDKILQQQIQIQLAE